MEHGYRDHLAQQATGLGVSEQIHFLDFVDKPQAIMQLCNCIVLATYMETFGLVLPEAMRAGIAVIGSNAGGVPEIIEHGKTGLLFEPKNADDLKEQILKLYTDRNLLEKLAAQGMKKADTEFNDDKHFAQSARYFSESNSCQSLMHSPKKILVIRNDKLGDFMLIFPALSLLKKAFPAAEIHALVPEYTAPMAKLCPWIDHVVTDTSVHKVE